MSTTPYDLIDKEMVHVVQNTFASIESVACVGLNCEYFKNIYRYHYDMPDTDFLSEKG